MRQDADNLGSDGSKEKQNPNCLLVPCITTVVDM